MKTALYCNVSINDFYELTPRELNMIVENHTLKAKEEFKTNMTLAYYNAYFQRVQKMPKLENVLKGFEGEEKKQMSDDDMLSMVQNLHRAFGGV